MEVIRSKGLDKPEHYWVKLDRKKYCQVCHIDRERRPRREPLAEIDNFNNKRQRRGAQSRWAVQDVRIVYAVEIRAVGRLYMHRYQYIRAFGLSHTLRTFLDISAIGQYIIYKISSVIFTLRSRSNGKDCFQSWRSAMGERWKRV